MAGTLCCRAEFPVHGTDAAFCSWLFLINVGFDSLCALASEGAACCKHGFFWSLLSSNKKLKTLISVWKSPAVAPETFGVWWCVAEGVWRASSAAPQCSAGSKLWGNGTIFPNLFEGNDGSLFLTNVGNEFMPR